MIRDILKNPLFNIAFSFMLGVGIVAIVRPMCEGKNGECTIEKAPPVKDWDGAVYRVAGKCYEYKTQTIECPKSKEEFIESFNSQFSERKSHLSAPNQY